MRRSSKTLLLLLYGTAIADLILSTFDETAAARFVRVPLWLAAAGIAGMLLDRLLDRRV